MLREDTSLGPGDRGEPIPHDQIFKTAFQIFLRDLVELLDPGLADHLDLEEPSFLEQEAFADFPKGRRSEADLVAETRTRDDEERLVLVHVEIEGEKRETIEERLERYSMHLRLKYDKPVVTAVVFLTGGPKGVARREVKRKVGTFECGRFAYLAFGLSGSEAEDYLERPQPLAAALAALMRSRVGDKVVQKLECLRAIGRAKLDEARRFVLTKIVEIYLRLESEDEDRFRAEIEQETNEEVREMVITWEEALEEREARGIAVGEARGLAVGEARGLAVGEARGLAVGEERGQVLATREAILLLVRRWIAEDASVVESRLAQIGDLDRLHEILERAVDARSVEELIL